MWSLVYTAVSEHYGRLEREGLITDEELEARMLQLQRMSLVDLSALYVDLFKRPATTLED